ncbi:hypothetical protein JCM3775_007500 [Rhodotorula graminis]
MDPHDTSFSPIASTSSSLDSRLGRLALGTNNRPAGRPTSSSSLIQDEDMSFALAGGDDSLDFAQGGDALDEETVRLSAGGDSARQQPGAAGAGAYGDSKGKAPLRDTDLFFGGSMASASAVPASQRFAPAGLPPPTTSSAHDGPDGGPAAVDDDDTEMDGGEGYTEDERARIASLRSERDGLRSMNGVLEEMRGALAGMEGKMQAFEATIDTSHQLLNLYTRIASQAEHTRGLILDREWQGVSQDHATIVERDAAHAAELERQALAAAEAAQRAEEERVRAERAAEERRRREEEAVRAPAGRGRGRGLRGAASSSNLRGSSLRGSSSSSLRGSARPPASSTSTSSPSVSSSSGIPMRGSAPVSGVRGVRGLRSRVATAGARGGRGRGAAE